MKGIYFGFTFVAQFSLRTISRALHILLWSSFPQFSCVTIYQCLLFRKKLKKFFGKTVQKIKSVADEVKGIFSFYECVLTMTLITFDTIPFSESYTLPWFICYLRSLLFFSCKIFMAVSHVTTILFSKIRSWTFWFDSKYKIHYNIWQQKMGVNRLNPVQKATYFF